MTEDKNIFEALSYVVLLHNCDENNASVWGSAMPINYCYQLRASSDTYTFCIDEDCDGIPNGWSLAKQHADPKLHGNLKLRAATAQEIKEYKRLGKPFNVSTLKQVKDIYPIF